MKNGKAVFIAHGCTAVGTAEAGDNGAICQRITLDAVGRHGGKRRSSLGGFETLFFTRDCAIPPHVVDSAKGETAYCRRIGSPFTVLRSSAVKSIWSAELFSGLPRETLCGNRRAVEKSAGSVSAE